MATTYTGTLTAFITNSRTTPADIANKDSPLEGMSYYSEDTDIECWIKVGTAQITVTMYDENKVLQGIVDSIDKQIQTTYAEAESKINLLKQKKQELLAITMEAP
jgi:hypothetical protein